jgi:hypothetical protein
LALRRERYGRQLGWIHTVLITAFGFGIWASAGRNRAVRIVDGLILAYVSLGHLWPFAPMHQREVLASGGDTFSDTRHRALGGVTVFLMSLAIGVGATAFGRRFRPYSIATIVVLLTFGALTFLEAPRLQSDLPTPWIGLWERINISVFLLWVVVLAVVLLQNETSQEGCIMSRPSPFKTPEGKARFLAAYDAVLKRWPVPFEEARHPDPLRDDARCRGRPEECPGVGVVARVYGDVGDVGAQYCRLQPGLPRVHRRHGPAEQEHARRTHRRCRRLRHLVDRHT